MKKIMMKQNEFVKLRQFKSFQSKIEMDKHVYAHCKNPLINRNMRQFIRLLNRYSVMDKHTGVCWRKVSELAKEMEVSERSISRYVAHLVDLGVLEVVETYTLTKDKRASQGANIYVILPCKSINEAVSQSVDLEGDDKKTDLVKTKKQSNTTKSIRKGEVTLDQLSDEFIPSFIPTEFTKVTKPYLTSTETFTAWGKILLSSKHTKTDINEPDKLSLAIDTFKQCIFMKKAGKIKKSFMGYLYAGLQRVFIQQRRKDNVSNYQGDVSLSWLSGGQI